MKVEIAADRTGVPAGVATDAASVPETALGPAALGAIPAAAGVPAGVPVLADRGYDSDHLRAYLAGEGDRLAARHRKNRVRPPTADGRSPRRLKRRWVVERTFAWVHSFRRVVTRFARRVDLCDGFVHLACAFTALGRLVKQALATRPTDGRLELTWESLQPPGWSPGARRVGRVVETLERGSGGRVGARGSGASLGLAVRGVLAC